MNNKLILLVFLSVLFLPFYAFAQEVKVVDLDGQVMVKKDVTAQWEKAQVNMLLNKDAEVETKGDSFCTLAFDEEQKNIVTLKQNSRVKIDSIKPGSVFLPKGRVFSLIKNLSKNEKFQIRTPTAIAGARGTGWATEYDGKETSTKCFEDTCFVQALDPSGNILEERDIMGGSGVDVGTGGAIGETHGLTGTDNTEWNDFTGYSGDLPGTEGSQGNTNNNPVSSGPDATQDLKQEQRNDQHEQLGQERREENTPESHENTDETPPKVPDNSVH